jgi:hypothetical protein
MRRQEAAAYAAVETERQVLAGEEGPRASQRSAWQAPLPLNGQMRQHSPDRVLRLGRPRRRRVVFSLLSTGRSVFGIGAAHAPRPVHGVRHRDHRRRGRGCLQPHEPTPASTLARGRAQVCLTLTAAYLGKESTGRGTCSVWLPRRAGYRSGSSSRLQTLSLFLLGYVK